MTKKKMAKRIMVTATAAMFSFFIPGCGKSETITTASPQTEAEASTESSKVDDALSFIKSGEIYFDNKLGATISIDGKKLDGNTAAFKNGLSVSVEDVDPNVEVDLFIVYTNNEGKSMVIFASGVDHSRISEALSKKLKSDMEKVYVCLCKTGEKWNMDLSESMNKLIKQYLPDDMEGK